MAQVLALSPASRGHFKRPRWNKTQDPSFLSAGSFNKGGNAERAVTKALIQELVWKKEPDKGGLWSWQGMSCLRRTNRFSQPGVHKLVWRKDPRSGHTTCITLLGESSLMPIYCGNAKLSDVG